MLPCTINIHKIHYFLMNFSGWTVGAFYYSIESDLSWVVTLWWPQSKKSIKVSGISIPDLQTSTLTKKVGIDDILLHISKTIAHKSYVRYSSYDSRDISKNFDPCHTLPTLATKYNRGPKDCVSKAAKHRTRVRPTTKIKKFEPIIVLKTSLQLKRIHVTNKSLTITSFSV